MRMLLMKTIPVSIRKNIGTYILLTLLVAAGMYIASATAGITYSYNVAYTETTRASNREDGQFQVYEPLGDEEEQRLIREGYDIERAYYFDVDMDDGSVLRVMKPRQSIDKIILDEGKLPEKDTEAVLEKCYAYHHKVKLSDTVSCAGKSYLVTGLGSVIDYDSPSRGLDDYSSDSEAFGIIFVTPDAYQTLLMEMGRDAREIYVYAYKLPEGGTDDDLRLFLIDNMGQKDNLISFVPIENNNRVGSARNDNEPYAVVGLLTGIGLLIMISLIFYLRLRLTLEKESPSIGALLAMGVRRKDIYPMFLVPFAAAGVIGGLAGYILSRIFDMAEVAGGAGYYSIPEVPMKSHPLIFLRGILGKEGTAYNMIYSDERLDYRKDQLYAMMEKEDLISPIDKLEPEVNASRDLFYALAILFYTIMMVYLVQFSIVQSQGDMAILSSFGYRSTELTRAFIGKLIIVAGIAAAVCLPMAYLFSKWMMPTLIASTPIGLMIDYHLSEYLFHLSSVILIIVLSVIPGWMRIRNIDILYYLRSRE